MHCLWNGEYGDYDLSFAPATVAYRMKTNGMTLEEAIKTNRRAKGRPRKQ